MPKLLLATVPAAIVAVTVLSPAAPAQAASLGTISITPNTGSVTESPMFAQAQTAAPCPTGFGDNVSLKIESADGTVRQNLVPVQGAGNYDKANLRLSPNRSFATAWQRTPPDGTYAITIRCSNEVLGEAPDHFATTVTVAGGTWTAQAPPSDAQETTTALAVTPAGQAPQGDTLTLTATVTPDNVPGKVLFKDRSTSLPPTGGEQPIPVSNGTASLTISSLVAGSHELSAVFTPDDLDAFLPSTSEPVSYTIVGPTTTPTPTGTGTPTPTGTGTPTPTGTGTPTPTDSETDEPEPTDTPTDTTEPTPDPSDTATVPAGDVQADVLPKTGPAAMSIAFGGVVLVAAGAAAMFVTRRNRRDTK